MKKVSVFSIVLYTCAGFVGAFAVWTMVKTATYIDQMVTAGQFVLKGNEYHVIDFYMAPGGQYIIFALLLAAAGFIIQKLLNIKNDINQTIEVESFEYAADELDLEEDPLDDFEPADEAEEVEKKEDVPENE